MADSVDDEKTALLKARIEELQKQLAAVAEQKDKIIELQNGKAGNVYVISNIGSFGEGAVSYTHLTARPPVMPRGSACAACWTRPR